jgi:hypothetical protein
MGYGTRRPDLPQRALSPSAERVGRHEGKASDLPRVQDGLPRTLGEAHDPAVPAAAAPSAEGTSRAA